MPADSNQAQGIGQYAKEPLLAFPFLGSRVSGFGVWESLGGVGKHDRLLYSSASRAWRLFDGAGSTRRRDA